MKKRCILAVGDYGTSGISESLRLPLRYMHDQGHEIWQLALGYQGICARVDPELYPWRERLLPVRGNALHEKFGQADIAVAIETAQPDIIISGFDAWMVAYLAQPEITPYLDARTRSLIAHQSRNFTHVAYFPIDGAVEGEYLPIGMEEMIGGFDVPVTYSRYSKKLIWKNLSIDVPFIPIAHDPKIYKPYDKLQARKDLKFPEDAYLIGMVATNQYRKLWGQFFEAVVPVARRHEDVFILPWTTWNSQILGGSEISDFAYRSGVADRCINPSEVAGQVSEEGMAKVFAALDVLILTTVGEGCGLPPLHARACGTPALVSDNTSNTEFCAHEFERIPCSASFYDPFGSNIRRYLTDTRELERRIEILYNNRDFAKEIGQAGIEEMKQYEYENIMPMWEKVFAEAGI